VLAALDPTLLEEISVPDSLNLFIHKFMEDNKQGPPANSDDFEEALFNSNAPSGVAMEGGVEYT
jgi:hypothetical protein